MRTILTTMQLYLVRLFITILIFLILLWRVDLNKLIYLLSPVSFKSFLTAAYIQIILILISAIRWWLILKILGIEISLLKSIRLFWEGLFFNNFLPGGFVGDGARTLNIQAAAGSVEKALTSVVLDRMLGLFGLLTVLLVFGVKAILNYYEFRYILLLATMFITLSLIFFVCIFKFYNYLKFIAHINIIYNFSKVLHYVVSSKCFPLMVLFAIMSPILSSFMAYILILDLDSQVTLADCFLIMPLITLVMMFPISIGGWGIRETAMVTFFGYANVSTEQAVLVSVIMGTISLLIALPGGVINLIERKNK